MDVSFYLNLFVLRSMEAFQEEGNGYPVIQDLLLTPRSDVHRSIPFQGILGT